MSDLAVKGLIFSENVESEPCAFCFWFENERQLTPIQEQSENNGQLSRITNFHYPEPPTVFADCRVVSSMWLKFPSPRNGPSSASGPSMGGIPPDLSPDGYLLENKVKDVLFSNEAGIFSQPWHLFTVGDEAVDLTTVEIWDADTFHEAGANKCFHALPAIEIIDTSVQVLLVGVERKQVVAVLFVRHRPVDQVEVEVFEPEVLQGRFASFANGIRVVECVPHLARDEQILSKDGVERRWKLYSLPKYENYVCKS